MLLAIDSGNTNVVFAVYERDTCRAVWRVANDPKRTGDEYAVILTQLFDVAGLTLSDIDGVIIGSVVPEARFNLVVFCEKYFGSTPMLFSDPGLDLGVKVLVDRPDQVGDDRLANTVAAFGAFGGPLIIIDFGTATTFDVIDGEGSYTGGVIAPGINLSIDALYRAASRLPRISVRKPDKVIGTATVSAMESGIFWGYVGLIEGITRRIAGEFGQPLKTVGTGGLATIFAEATDIIEAVDPDMTTRGLAEIYYRNAE